MNIGIDGREFVRGKITGISRFLLNFLEYATVYKPHWQFYVFLNQNCELPLHKDNLVKITIPQKITLLWDQLLVLKAVNEFNVGLFYSPYYKFPILTKIPVVTTVFDIIYLLVEPYKHYFKNNFYIKNFIRLTSHKVKKIVTSSYTSKEELVRVLGINKNKIEVVYLSVDKKFTPQPEEKIIGVIKKYQIDSKYILYVGNSKPHKNLKRLIKAYKLLPQKIKDEYVLVLAGVDVNEVYEERSISNEKSIKIIDFVKDEDLPAIYSGASLFVFPSLCEGFGLPPLEAMACGCPVISSNTSSMPEILNDACLYFNPYDIQEMACQIQKVVRDEVLRKELRCKGIEHAKNFTVNNMVETLIRIFELV